jgi:hypothetical protein
MELKEFTFDPALTEPFLALGSELYRDDRSFVPPLREELRAQLAPSFPFYRQEGNAHRRFLAFEKGRPVARALASVNRDLVEGDQTRVGAVGFFEAAEDHHAALAVLSAAVDWLRRAHGIKRIWGPLNFDIWHGYRLMTRGFDRERFLGEPFNKAYYPSLFDSFGFRPRQRWNTLELEGPGALEVLLAQGGDERRRFCESGYRLEPFSLARFGESLGKLHRVLTRSFSGFLGYTPISLAEFSRLMSALRFAIHPECSVFVLDDAGRLAGFAGVLRELSEAVRAMRGASSPLSTLRFLGARRPSRRLMLHVGGITPAEASKHNGVARGAFYEVLARLRGSGCETVLATLVAKGNPVRRLYGPYASDVRREYTLYGLDL